MGEKQLVYIVEDDASIRELEIYALKNSEFEVKGFESGKSMMAQLENKAADIILLDIMLPDGNGFDLFKKIRRYSDLPVIFLTAVDDEDSVVNGLELGADDYITKPFNILEVKARIKAIIRRSGRSGQKKDENKNEQIQTENEAVRLDKDGRRAFIEGREVSLTAKEFELLEFLMNHPNKIYSRDKLLHEVWGADYPGDVRTVDVHIRRMREKIETNPSEPKYLHTKWGVGYYFDIKK